MDAKLTLKLDKLVIEKAKKYAFSHNKSLSRMIESYLKSLIEDVADDQKDNIEISPFVKSMKTGVKIPVDLDYRKTYDEYLMDKYR